MTNTVWDHSRVETLFNTPLLDLLFQAQQIHRQHFVKKDVQLSSLLSIKTGACPEDCAYCPQSGHYKTGVKKEKLLDVDAVLANAKAAKAQGATRFCMGAAWKKPPKKDFPKVLAMVKAVKALGLETCVTLGNVDAEEAASLKAVGLDYYNHNIDTSPEYYKEIISTRTFSERLNTLEEVRSAGINVCCGGILGMGESREDRINFLLALAGLPAAPESVPINRLIAIPGTPLAAAEPLDNFEFVRTIAVARIMFPASRIRLSAGREAMSEEMHALCFFAGANSIFFGEQLLTAANPAYQQDLALIKKLGLSTQAVADHVS